MRTFSWPALVLAGCGATQAEPRTPPIASTEIEVRPPAVTAPAEPDGSATIETPPPADFDVAALRDRAAKRQRHTARMHAISLEPALVPLWEATVGKTTFRTTMAVVDDDLVIGTHGTSLDGKNERDDGVYLLDAKTGTTRRFIATPGSGDRDVGGIAVAGDHVFFGTDQGKVIAATTRGTILWTAPAEGKVRPAPALGDLDSDGDLDVVVGDEGGWLRAFDGGSGQPHWAMKTGANAYGARGFIGAAALADLDGDGADDVIAGARDGILSAYRGTDGHVLWQIRKSSGIHASPSVADLDGDGRPEVIAAWSYGDIVIADGATGAERWTQRLAQDDGGIEGLFGSPVPLPSTGRGPGVLVAPTAWWGEDDGVVLVGAERRRFRSYEGRVSSTAVVTDLGDDGILEAILGTEAGAVIALRADGGRAVLAKLPGPVEAPALVADVDGNGTQELIVAAGDGKLRCFETGSSTPPVLGRFRGNGPDNRGDLGRVSLAWHVSAPEPAAAASSVRVDYLTCCRALSEAATRAPRPRDRLLMEAASECLGLAANATDRAAALEAIVARLGTDAPVPEACR